MGLPKQEQKQTVGLLLQKICLFSRDEERYLRVEVRILRVFCVRERGDTELTEVGSECRVLKKGRSGVCGRSSEGEGEPVSGSSETHGQ